jgi:hypothetical protein
VRTIWLQVKQSLLAMLWYNNGQLSNGGWLLLHVKCDERRGQNGPCASLFSLVAVTMRRCLIREPTFFWEWCRPQQQQQGAAGAAPKPTTHKFNSITLSNPAAARSVPVVWQCWQQSVLLPFVQLHKLLAQLSSSAAMTA